MSKERIPTSDGGYFVENEDGTVTKYDADGNVVGRGGSGAHRQLSEIQPEESPSGGEAIGGIASGAASGALMGAYFGPVGAIAGAAIGAGAAGSVTTNKHFINKRQEKIKNFQKNDLDLEEQATELSPLHHMGISNKGYDTKMVLGIPTRGSVNNKYVPKPMRNIVDKSFKPFTSLGNHLFGKGHPDYEGLRLQGLVEKGILPADYKRVNFEIDHKDELAHQMGVYKDDQGKEIGQDAAGYYINQDTGNKEYVNTKFTRTRDEKDLDARNLTEYSTFYNKFGKDWQGKLGEADRLNIAKYAIDHGLVDEHNDTVDIDWNNKEFQAYYNDVLANPTMQEDPLAKQAREYNAGVEKKRKEEEDAAKNPSKDPPFGMGDLFPNITRAPDYNKNYKYDLNKALKNPYG